MGIYGSIKKQSKILLLLVSTVFSVAVAKVVVLPSLSSGELSPRMEGRTDLKMYYSGGRTVENMVVKAQGGVRKRPGTEYITSRIADMNIPGTPAVPATYKFTYFSDNGPIWGIPVADGALSITLDAAAVINIGGGIVEMACTGHLFEVGQVIQLGGTTNYNATSYTLTAGTTTNALQFAAGYVAETMDGTETVVRYILPPGEGAVYLCRDSSQNIYIGTSWDAANSTYVKKLDTNGNWTTAIVTAPHWPIDGYIGSKCQGIAISSDDQYLYLWIGTPAITPRGYMEKYDLTTGAMIWGAPATETTWPGIGLAIDADGNAYGARQANLIAKFASADGALTTMTDTYSRLNILVDDTLDVVIGAGQTEDAFRYNIWVRTLDDSAGGKLRIPDTVNAAISIGCLECDGTNIFALAYATNTGIYTLYKLLWNGTTLSIVSSTGANLPTYPEGLYVDLYGNLVILNRVQSDKLWFYDKDLTYLSKIGNMIPGIGNTWSGLAYGGDILIDGDLGTPEGVTQYWSFNDGAENPLRLIPFEYSTSNSYVLEIGHRYIGFFHEAD